MSADDLYHDALKTLARSGVGHGRLARPDATATVDNPLCGDRVTVDLEIEDGRVARVGHEVKGCLLCEAAAALLAETAPGRTREELEALPQAARSYLKSRDDAVPLAGLAAFAPVRAFRSRHRCVTLPFEALVQALR